MSVVLCTLSGGRLSMLESSPELVAELLEARNDTEIPGLLELGATWHALDYVISRGGEDPVLGDAVVGRKGRPFAVAVGRAKPRILSPERVREIARALSSLPPDHVRSRYDELHTQDLVGFSAGSQSQDALDLASVDEDDSESDAQRQQNIEELEQRLAELQQLYASAAAKEHSMLSVVV